MRAKEVIIWCDENGCKGAMKTTALANPDGAPVIFWLTEDENIHLKMYCSQCGGVIVFTYSIVQFLLDCPKDKGKLI